jgi:hypothetical protein
MNAIYCKKCHEILYSYKNYHWNQCSCGNCYIDAEGNRIGFTDRESILELQLNTEFLFKNLIINHKKMDFSKMGTFKIKSTSNEKFYKQAIVNWEEFEPYFKEVALKTRLEILIEVKRRGQYKNE